MRIYGILWSSARSIKNLQNDISTALIVRMAPHTDHFSLFLIMFFIEAKRRQGAFFKRLYSKRIFVGYESMYKSKDVQSWFFGFLIQLILVHAQ